MQEVFFWQHEIDSTATTTQFESAALVAVLTIQQQSDMVNASTMATMLVKMPCRVYIELFSIPLTTIWATTLHVFAMNLAFVQ